jgi:hypothetical protein
MVDPYCTCGIKHRQLFNDVFTCPRCPKIIVKKDHVTLTWRGDMATVLLDEFEKYITQALLARREEAQADVGDEPLPAVPKPVEAPRAPADCSEPTQPCERCNTLMPAGCGKICTNCKWVSPCSIG